MGVVVTFVGICDVDEEPTKTGRPCDREFPDEGYYPPGYSASWWEKAVLIKKEHWSRSRRKGKSVMMCPEHNGHAREGVQ